MKDKTDENLITEKGLTKAQKKTASSSKPSKEIPELLSERDTTPNASGLDGDVFFSRTYV